jgi:hypothetical protein
MTDGGAQGAGWNDTPFPTVVVTLPRRKKTPDFLRGTATNTKQ